MGRRRPGLLGFFFYYDLNFFAEEQKREKIRINPSRTCTGSETGVACHARTPRGLIIVQQIWSTICKYTRNLHYGSRRRHHCCDTKSRKWLHRCIVRFFKKLLHHSGPPSGRTATGSNRHSPMCTLAPPLPYTDHRTVIRLSNRVANGCWSAIILLRPGGGVTRKLYSTGLNDAPAGALRCDTADFDLRRWCFGPIPGFKGGKYETKKTNFFNFFFYRVLVSWTFTRFSTSSRRSAAISPAIRKI